MKTLSLVSSDGTFFSAIDASKIKDDFGWQPGETIETGINKTVKWYLDNAAWLDEIISGDYKAWVKSQYN